MKKQLILSGAFVFLLGLMATAQDDDFEPVATGPTTTMLFDETEYHFGKINSGDIVQHIFRFTNTGDEPLLLTNAKGSCGCTVPSWPQDPIPPGGTGAIVVEFDSKGKSGPQTKMVTITANTDPAMSIFYIKGEVASNVETDDDEAETRTPQKVYWPVKPAAYTASVFPNPAAGEFSLKVLDADGQAASIEIFNNHGQLMAKQDVASWEGTLQLDAKDFPVGNYWLSLKMGDAERFSLPFVVAR